MSKNTGRKLRNYEKPKLTRNGNLKDVTADWQCSVGDSHGNQRGRGHSSHGNGNGYGHCK